MRIVRTSQARSLETMRAMTNNLFILGNVLPQNGGVTHAVYARANVLAPSASRTIIATLNFDINFESHVARLKESGMLGRSVEVVNQYARWAGPPARPRRSERRPDWSYIADSRREHAFRVFDREGEYVRYEAYRDNGTLEFIDHFEAPWTRVRKTIFDTHGVPRKELYMSRSTNRPEFQVLRDNHGTPVVSSKLDDQGRPITYISHSRESEYRTEIDMAVPWVAELVDDLGEASLFIDKREFVRPLRQISGVGVKKIFVMHNTHLGEPFTDPSKVSPTVDDALSGVRSGEIDRMVVLTDEQAADIGETLGGRERVAVIPHYVVAPDVPKTQRDRKLVVSLARYHHAKNLGAALDVFSEVLKSVPDARYEIYGYGPELSRLKQKAIDLEIQNSVLFAGFTEASSAVFARASVSLLTSRYEGFGLVLIESLSCGTPAVSFDTKYGPRAVIRDGVDGVLVPRGDDEVSRAAAAVVELLQDDAVFERMSSAGPEVVQRFSAESAAAKWNELTAAL